MHAFMNKEERTDACIHAHACILFMYASVHECLIKIMMAIINNNNIINNGNNNHHHHNNHKSHRYAPCMHA